MMIEERWLIPDDLVTKGEYPSSGYRKHIKDSNGNWIEVKAINYERENEDGN